MVQRRLRSFHAWSYRPRTAQVQLIRDHISCFDGYPRRQQMTALPVPPSSPFLFLTPLSHSLEPPQFQTYHRGSPHILEHFLDVFPQSRSSLFTSYGRNGQKDSAMLSIGHGTGTRELSTTFIHKSDPPIHMVVLAIIYTFAFLFSPCSGLGSNTYNISS